MGVPLKILLVEDSEDDALLLLRELRRGGYEPAWKRVDTAEAMEAALDERGWDLVVSDHFMPAFSSVAALDLLRRKGFVDLPFIIVSGQIGEDAAVAAMKAGAHDYLMKDNLARLNTAIERELREAEVRRERRRAEEKYRSIFENAVEGIFQTTVEGRFLTANPALARMFGYGSPEELLDAVSDIGHEKLYVEAERRAELYRVARQDGFVSGFEVRMYRKDGSPMWASMSARATYDVAGEIVGYEGTMVDITARKRAEEALREIRDTERRRIARELHDVVLQDLTYALQSMQVVRAIPGGVDRDEEAARQMEALKRAVGGLRDAIYDLRTENVREHSLVRSLESIVELNRQMGGGRTLELVVDENFPKEVSAAAGIEVVRVVQEALVNVRRHSGARRATVSLGVADDEIRVEIEDDGQGFGPETSPGIGLTGMHERVHGLGGKLEVTSEEGVGTRVSLRVTLPALTAGDAENFSNA